MATIEQSISFHGTRPADLFDLYLDAQRHAAAIGAPVAIGRTPGVPFKAFGEGHVTGTILEVVPGRRIVQTWRGTPWADGDLDSILVLTFSKTSQGAKIELVQTGIPDHAAKIIDEGWCEMYWSPWKKYLSQFPSEASLTGRDG